MKNFSCQCGNTLFFDNSFCVRCQHETAWCPKCKRIVALLPTDQAGVFKCGGSGCGESLKKCDNYTKYQVCNQALASQASSDTKLCISCQLTTVIPDLSNGNNKTKWARLEAAKRRLLYSLDLIGLPYGGKGSDMSLPLSFEFKEGGPGTVSTGHLSGKITVNISEADDVEREKARVAFDEPQRTLISHLRHEIGHYYWDVLVKDRSIFPFRNLFGDERNPTYSAARAFYYRNGPRSDWASNYVSAYASMHPWEDFAETFGAYLDIRSVLETATENDLPSTSDRDLDAMLKAYQKLGIAINEINREMGLKDLVPEVFVQSVMEKLLFVHENVVVANQAAVCAGTLAGSRY